MTTGVLLVVAGRQVNGATRRIVREVSGGRVPTHVAVPVVLALGLGVVTLLTLQSVSLGRQLGSGFGPGLVASVLSFAGMALGVTSIIGSHMWSDVTRREREALAVLPLGGWQLSVLAAVPALLPTLVALTAAVPSLVALGVTTRMSFGTMAGALALGLATPVVLAVVWTLPLLALRPRRDLVVVVWVALSLGAVAAHAFWAASQDAAPAGPSRLNPVLWVLRKPDQYTLTQTCAAVAALAAATGALLWLRRVRRSQTSRRSRRGALRTSPARSSLTALRVWTGLVRIIWRQSSLFSELGVAALLSALVSFLASVLLVQGRDVHGTTALLVAVGFGALPLLGVRSALGPTFRLTQLGMGAGDIRIGLTAAAAVFFGVPLLPGVLIMAWRGVALRHFVVMLALAAVAFAIVLSCGVVLRGITATSLGRTVGVGVCMALLYALIHAGLPTWPALAIVAAGVVSTALLALVLRLAVTQQQVA